VVASSQSATERNEGTGSRPPNNCEQICSLVESACAGRCSTDNPCCIMSASMSFSQVSRLRKVLLYCCGSLLASQNVLSFKKRLIREAALFVASLWNKCGYLLWLSGPENTHRKWPVPLIKSSICKLRWIRTLALKDTLQDDVPSRRCILPDQTEALIL